MKFLVYSEITAARIASSLGMSEYSYYFVLRDFLPVLQKLGQVVVVENPEVEVDAHYEAACAAGERCLFLSFSPPHKTTLGLRCPTLPVFAWEFDSIPNESWLDEPEQDWRHALRLCGSGIVHSELTAQAVKQVLGEDFPVIAIPSPVWDKFHGFRDAPALPLVQPMRLHLTSGVVLDTHDVALEPYMPGLDAVARAVQNARIPQEADKAKPAAQQAAAESRLHISLRYFGEWYRQVLCGLLPALPQRRRAPVPAPAPVEPEAPSEPRLEPINQVEPAGIQACKPGMPEWTAGECSVELSGVVFTALFNPYDGRKNWVDMLTAFCAAFRDNPDATLLFKLGHHEYQAALNGMLMCIARLPKFKCRIVMLHGYLEKAEFDNLIKASTFVVNASHGEGQCLPLMELMSCGKPAIAPRHSAMLDYINEDVAFIVDSWLDATAWPHDPRLAYRTCRHQLDWASLVEAYRAAYHCARHEPERYLAMASAAIERLRTHCSRDVAKQRLVQFLQLKEHANEPV